MIEYPRQGSVYCNVTRAKITIALVYVVICIICIPNSSTLFTPPAVKKFRTFENPRWRTASIVESVHLCIPNFVSITVQSKPYLEEAPTSDVISCGSVWNASTAAVAAGNSTSPVPLIWVVTFKLDN